MTQKRPLFPYPETSGPRAAGWEPTPISYTRAGAGLGLLPSGSLRTPQRQTSKGSGYPEAPL